MRTRAIAVMVTDLDCLRAFLFRLPTEVKQTFGFFFFVDDRNFQIMDALKSMRKNSSLFNGVFVFEIVSGKTLLEKYNEKYEFPSWLFSWKRTIKVLIPLYIMGESEWKGVRKFIFLDDDTVILKYPHKMLKEDYSASSAGVMGRKSNSEYMQILLSSFGKSLEEFNATPLCSGAFVFTVSQAAYSIYKSRFLNVLCSSAMQKLYWKGAIFGDQPFIDLVLRQLSVKIVSNKVCFTNSWTKGAYKKRLEDFPEIYHYAVGDKLVPEFVDYFISLTDDDDGALVSKYKTREEFENRKMRTKIKFRKEFTKLQAKQLKAAISQLNQKVRNQNGST
jgi:hypothetical protein